MASCCSAVLRIKDGMRTLNYRSYFESDLHHNLCLILFIVRKLAHAIYRDIFGCKIGKFHWINFYIFYIFAQNIDCGYTVLTSTHNLCFGSKI